MRPGRARPGCLEADDELSLVYLGFNEAGARAPRMPGMKEWIGERTIELQ